MEIYQLIILAAVLGVLIGVLLTTGVTLRYRFALEDIKYEYGQLMDRKQASYDKHMATVPGLVDSPCFCGAGNAPEEWHMEWCRLSTEMRAQRFALPNNCYCFPAPGQPHLSACPASNVFEFPGTKS